MILCVKLRAPALRTDSDVAEHHCGNSVVKLEADGTGFGTSGIAGAFGDYLTVDTNADEAGARLDVHAVPEAGTMHSRLGWDQFVDAAGGVGGIIVQNLNLVADM